MKDQRQLTAGSRAPAAEAPLVIDPPVLGAIPAAVYLCAAGGIIVQFNRRATELGIRSPFAGDTDERFYGAFGRKSLAA